MKIKELDSAYAYLLGVVTEGNDGTIIVKDMIIKWLQAEHEEGENNED